MTKIRIEVEKDSDERAVISQDYMPGVSISAGGSHVIEMVPGGEINLKVEMKPGAPAVGHEKDVVEVLQEPAPPVVTPPNGVKETPVFHPATKPGEPAKPMPADGLRSSKDNP